MNKHEVNSDISLVNQQGDIENEMPKNISFEIGDVVVYPTHGIGEIQSIEYLEVFAQSMYVIFFKDEEITLKIPVKRAASIGLRHISTEEEILEVFEVIKLREIPLRGGIWNKRSQEYESKINSGNLLLVAEVTCDLYYNASNPERSYSERVIHETACNRFTQEVALGLKKTVDEVNQMIHSILNIDYSMNSYHSDDDIEDEEGLEENELANHSEDEDVVAA